MTKEEVMFVNALYEEIRSELVADDAIDVPAGSFDAFDAHGCHWTYHFKKRCEHVAANRHLRTGIDRILSHSDQFSTPRPEPTANTESAAQASD
jgi:hypothetical protein